MVGRDLLVPLGRALGGDPEAVADLASFEHATLLQAQKSVGPPLILGRDATVAVLRGLLDQRFTPADVHSWASLMRRGYIAGRNENGPIEPLDIDFDAQWEDGISAAVSRLDEIGDIVDGEVADGEILDLLQLLGEL
jgi:hypothetical protein